MAHPSAARLTQLQNLRYHWGEAYEIELEDGEFIAVRRDNRRDLRSDSAEGLRNLIIADYSGRQVPRKAGE